MALGFGRPDWVMGAPSGELDAFFGEYVAGVFKEFGYRKRGAYWTKVSPNGDTSSVWFQRSRRPYVAAFYVEPGFWTAVYAEALRRSGQPQKVTPDVGLRHDRLWLDPPEARLKTQSLWSYGDAQSREEVGRRLRSVLHDSSLPQLDGLRDRWATVVQLEEWDEVTARIDGWARPTPILLAYLTVDVADPLDDDQRRRVDKFVARAAKHRHRVQAEVDVIAETWERRKREAGVV